MDVADQVLIASSLHVYKQQCMLALSHGAHVLCEKPFAPLQQDALEIHEAVKTVEKTGHRVSDVVLRSYPEPEKDIRAGMFCAPRSLHSYVSWQRFDSYYNSLWKGRIKDAQGNWILDSILTNAPTHYLHNTFFVLGQEQDQATMPEALRVELYNGKGIETFDTAFVQGEFQNGCDFFLAATHSGNGDIDPVLHYGLENAVVTASGNHDSAEIIATFRDGTTRNYGAALGKYHVAQKIRTMLAVAANPSF